MGLEPDRIGIHVHNTHSSQSNFQDTVCLQYPISYTHQCIYIYVCLGGWVGRAYSLMGLLFQIYTRLCVCERKLANGFHFVYFDTHNPMFPCLSILLTFSEPIETIERA